MKKFSKVIATLLAAVALTSCGSLSLRDFPSTPPETGDSEDDAPSVSKVEVTKQPNKTTYQEGEVFDPTGLEIVATWSDGYVENIEGVVKYPKDPLVLGQTKVELEYSNFKFSIPVTVTKQPDVVSITVKTYPRQTYLTGEKFDPTGLVLTVALDDGTTKDVTEGYEYDENLTKNTTSVTITYKKKTASIPVTVVEGVDNKFEAELFETTGDATILSSVDLPNENINNPSGGKFVGGLNATLNAGFKFTIDSNKNTVARFTFCLGSNVNDAYKYTDTNTITVANSNSSQTITSNVTIDEGGWYSWKEYALFVIEIKEGLNTITVANKGGYSSNVDYVTISTDATVELSEEEIILTGNTMECEDMTPINGSYVDREPNCGEPSGGYYIGGMNSSVDGAGFKFMVRSSMDCVANFTVGLSRNGSVNYNYFDHHTIKLIYDDGSEPVLINKAYITAHNIANPTITKGSNWFNWTEINLLDFELKQGYTIIEVTTNLNSGVTIRSGNHDYVKFTNITDNSKGFEFFNPIYFEAEDSAELKTASTTYDKQNAYNKPSGSGFVTGMTTLNSSFSYDVVASEATQTTLMANIGLSDTTYKFSDVHDVRVYHEDGTSTQMSYNNTTIGATSTNKGYEWRLFDIGKVTLKEGNNKIVITHASGTGSGNFDYLILGSNNDFESAYKQVKRYEIEDSTFEHMESVTDATKAADASGNEYLAIGSHADAYFKVAFTVTKETYVAFNLRVGLTTDGAQQITSQYTITFVDAKGATYTYAPGYNFHKATGNSGYAWRMYVMGFMVAQPGTNYFIFERKSGSKNHGFDYLEITGYTTLGTVEGA